jgi:hypothetical protein
LARSKLNPSEGAIRPAVDNVDLAFSKFDGNGAVEPVAGFAGHARRDRYVV